MNSKLHHKWNAARDTTRGSCNEGNAILQEAVAENKVALKQVGPQQGKTDREN